MEQVSLKGISPDLHSESTGFECCRVEVFHDFLSPVKMNIENALKYYLLYSPHNFISHSLPTNHIITSGRTRFKLEK
jgi:hypothetical protein